MFDFAEDHTLLTGKLLMDVTRLTVMILSFYFIFFDSMHYFPVSRSVSSKISSPYWGEDGPAAQKKKKKKKLCALLLVIECYNVKLPNSLPVRGLAYICRLELAQYFS